MVCILMLIYGGIIQITLKINVIRIARNIVKRDFLCDFPTLCICFFFPEMLRHLYFIVKNENSGACGMRETPPRGAVGKMLHDGGHS